MYKWVESSLRMLAVARPMWRQVLLLALFALVTMPSVARAQVSAVDEVHREALEDERQEELADRIEAVLTVHAASPRGSTTYFGLSLLLEGVTAGVLYPALWAIDERTMPTNVVVMGTVGAGAALLAGVAVLATGSSFGDLAATARDVRRRHPPREAVARIERAWEEETRREVRRVVLFGSAEVVGGLGVLVSSVALFGADLELNRTTIASLLLNATAGAILAGSGVYHMLEVRPARDGLADWRRHHGHWQTSARARQGPAVAVTQGAVTLGWSGSF